MSRAGNSAKGRTNPVSKFFANEWLRDEIVRTCFQPGHNVICNKDSHILCLWQDVLEQLLEFGKAETLLVYERSHLL